MADENKSSWVADVFGNGGAGGIVSGAGDVICALKGTCVPQNVTYAQNPMMRNNTSMIWIIVAIAAVGLMAFMMLKK